MIDFQQVADCLAGIQQTGATSTKEMMLKRYGETVDGFKEVLKFIYDPYFTTGIKEAKLNNAYISDTYHEVTVEEIMDYLRTCNTGTLQDCQYALEFIYQEDDPNWQWAAEGLVTKDLQIGVSVTTLNKVYGKSFIPKIGIMRGMLCPEHWTGYGIATEKIDGNRRLFFNTKDGVKTYTRSGKPDTGLTEIEAEISSHLPKGYVFDCEFLGRLHVEREPLAAVITHGIVEEFVSIPGDHPSVIVLVAEPAVAQDVERAPYPRFATSHRAEIERCVGIAEAELVVLALEVAFLPGEFDDVLGIEAVLRVVEREGGDAGLVSVRGNVAVRYLNCHPDYALVQVAAVLEQRTLAYYLHYPDLVLVAYGERLA